MPSYVFPVLIVLQVVSALAIILLVLLQQGKGADMGSSFGGGSAGSLFGSAGSANFFSRLTKWVAVLFFACTLGLAYAGGSAYHKASKPTDDGSLMESFTPVAPKTDSSVPAAPDTGAVPTAPAVDTNSSPTTPQSVPANNTNNSVPAAPASN